MNKLLKIIATIIATVCVIVLILNVKINHIDIVGNEKINDVEIVKNIFEKPYDNISIILFLKDKIKEKKYIPLVKTYDIEWQTPFSITINIIENPIIGFVKKDIKNIYFDKNGIICEVSNERKADVIEVVGVSFRSNEYLDKIELSDERMLNAILNISSYLKESGFKAELLEITKDDEINVYMGNITVNLGGIQNMEIKLQRLKDIYPQISEYSGTLDLKNAKDNMLDEQYIFKKSG